MENVLNYNYSENEGKKTLTLSIVINDPGRDGFFNDLMDALGDVDCVSATELGNPYFIMDTDNNLYELDDNNVAKLEAGEEITLTSFDTLDNYADPEEDADFLAWVHGTDKD